MTTYHTGNPLGSQDPRDLFDNAQSIDHAANSLVDEVWVDRFGVARRTWRGIERKAELDIAQAVSAATSEAEGYRDGAREARDDAVAAASAIGPIKFFDTYSKALADLPNISESDLVEISRDETRAGARTRYFKRTGDVLEFLVNLDQLRIDLSEDGGADRIGFLPDLSTGAALRRVKDLIYYGGREGVLNSDRTTTALKLAFQESAGKQLTLNPGSWYFDDTIAHRMTETNIYARGATFYAGFDGLMFDVNPGSDPLNIEATSAAFVTWEGGMFRTALSPAAIENTVAMRAFGIRQFTWSDFVLGYHGQRYLNKGLEFANLGGHNIHRGRWLNVDIGVHNPFRGYATGDAAGPITTSNFAWNNWILSPGQRAVLCEGGFNRWTFLGGFANGSGVPVMEFTNHEDARVLNFIGVGFEQAVAGGKFVYIKDVGGITASSINIDNSTFNGDPFAGGHVALDFEKATNIHIKGGARIEGTAARGNWAIRGNASCSDLNVDASCKLPVAAGVLWAGPRGSMNMGRPVQRISDLVLSGYNGDSKSSGEVTLDMKTLLGGNWPVHASPTSYELIVQARDSASAGSSTAGVEVFRPTAPTTARTFVDLRGVPNSQRVGQTVHVNAAADGSISLRFYATGANTLDVWVYVTAINN